MVSRISASTTPRERAYLAREAAIIASKLSFGDFGIDNGVAENAGTFSPLIIIEITK